MRTRARQGCLISLFLFNSVLELLHNVDCTVKQKEEKSHIDFNGKNKTVPICRWSNYL